MKRIFVDKYTENHNNLISVEVWKPTDNEAGLPYITMLRHDKYNQDYSSYTPLSWQGVLDDFSKLSDAQVIRCAIVLLDQEVAKCKEAMKSE